MITIGNGTYPSAILTCPSVTGRHDPNQAARVVREQRRETQSTVTKTPSPEGSDSRT